MALSVTGVQQLQSESGFRIVTATFTLDTSYPSGGSPGVAARLGLNVVFALIVLHSKGYEHEYNKGVDTLRSYNSMPAHSHTENTAGAYTQNAVTSAVAAAPAAEVANGTNLSAITVDVIAFGN
jgi:hypothetical protein